MIANAIAPAATTSGTGGAGISNNGISHNVTSQHETSNQISQDTAPQNAVTMDKIGAKAPALQPSYAMLVAAKAANIRASNLGATDVTTAEINAAETHVAEIITPELAELLAAQLPLNGNTHAGTLTTNVHTATIRPADNQALLAAMNAQSAALPLTQALYTPTSTHPSTGLNTHLSLAPTVLRQVGSQTTSLPLATHLATTSLTVSGVGEHASVMPPLALSDPRTMEAVEVTNPLLAAITRPSNQVSQWGPVPITPTAPQAQQAQELLSPLREQLRFQIDQQIKKAEIRLDPPELGKVELSIRLDGDRLHIQMHAANASVRDSLQIGLERLRSELAMDHGGQIDVDVGQGENKQSAQDHQGSSIAGAQQHNAGAVAHPPKQQTSNGVDLLA
ncbi:flagellar hook-length control protein FliK [Shewanella sp. VB17]|uniref:flagellar hook-length control protein FliK n=1 Tax=Shewanella sp. VB17 TaxID=2739432 RepID=UPI00156379A4|nr:flagellar hook-length control protein FliK [Shewanella sp. VB17]NRD72019.1 flagellar hook-length control protein FliK [Shewanella sp. VB17]